MKKKKPIIFILILAICSVSFVSHFAFAESTTTDTISNLHFEGENGSKTITDTTGRTWTSNGNAKISTANYIEGSSSLYLDGTVGTNISTPYDATAFDMTNDYTIDMWVSFDDVTKVKQGLFGRNDWMGVHLEYQEVGDRKLRLFCGDGSWMYSAYGVPGQKTDWVNNKWYHIAWVKKGSTYRVFVDGQIDIEYTAPGVPSNPNYPFIIGNSNDQNRAFKGYIDGFRLTKAALWDTKFTPTPPITLTPTPTPTLTPTSSPTLTPTSSPTATPSTTPTPTPTVTTTQNNAIIEITMINGDHKEYEMTSADINNFINWYNTRATGVGIEYYIIDKNYNKGPFISRKEYIVFDKISSFEVMEYNN